MASLLFLLPLVLLWVLFVRPQQRRMRQAQAMVASLELGDEVITSGGIYGTITDTDESTVWLEIAPDLVVRVSRGAIASRVPTDLDDLVDDEDDDEEDDDGYDDGDDHAVDQAGPPASVDGPAANGSSAGVTNATAPTSPQAEPTTGDDEA